MTRFDHFWKQLRGSKRPILLLDYDGTLAPFQSDRDAAVPYPGVRELLSTILADGRTRLVVVTGRPCQDLVTLLDIDPHPEIWGCHGWERLLPDSHHHLADIPHRARMALAEAGHRAKQAGLERHCELKPVSIALHWRGLPEPAAADLRQRALQAWPPLATSGGLELHAFDGGLELRVPGKDKGTAVRQVIADANADTAIAYLGDDRTDEDAFLALKDRALTLLVRKEARPTAANYLLRPPDELIEFLRTWLEQTQSGKD